MRDEHRARSDSECCARPRAQWNGESYDRRSTAAIKHEWHDFADHLLSDTLTLMLSRTSNAKKSAEQAAKDMKIGQIGGAGGTRTGQAGGGGNMKTHGQDLVA